MNDTVCPFWTATLKKGTDQPQQENRGFPLKKKGNLWLTKKLVSLFDVFHAVLVTVQILGSSFTFTLGSNSHRTNRESKSLYQVHREQWKPDSLSKTIPKKFLLMGMSLKVVNDKTLSCTMLIQHSTVHR